jgi:hypothetical protein
MTASLRRFAARALSGVSVAFSVAARINEMGARWLDPGEKAPPPPPPAENLDREEAGSRIEDLFSDAAEDVTEVTERVADTLRAERPAEAPGTPPQSPSSAAASPEAVAPPPPTGEDLTEADRPRRPDSHTAELAEQTVADIVERIPSLSTSELEALYEYEQAHRNRKTVLTTIERSLAPDVERVYTTETGEG